MSAWTRLADALEAAAAGGRAATFWLRDDDAVTVTPALGRLGGMTSDAQAPLLLAAIPAKADEELARWVKARTHVQAAVHGHSHANHAPPWEKKQEFGLHRPLAAMSEELRSGLARTRALFGDRALPMFVPPWNRIAPAVADALPGLGFRFLSAFGRAPRQVEGITTLNAHVDIIDWRGTRGCRPHADLISETVALLEEARISPIGIVTHHLAHDEASWDFLSRLFEVTQGRARWISPGEDPAHFRAGGSRAQPA